MKKLILPATAISALALFASMPSAAKDELSYTYVEVNYLVQDVDLYEDDEVFDDIIEDIDDGDGFGIKGSYAFTEMFSVFAGYTQTEADFAFIDDTGAAVPQNEDVKTLIFGAALNFALARNTDLVVRGAYTDVDIGEFSLGQDDDDVDNTDDLEDAFDDLNEDKSDGYFADVGVRSLVSEYIELGGGLRYTDLDAGDDLSVFGEALFYLNDGMAITFAAESGDNLTTYGLGFRLTM